MKKFVEEIKSYEEKAHEYIVSPSTALRYKNNTKQKFRDALDYHLRNIKGVTAVPEKVLRQIEYEVLKSKPIEIDLDSDTVKMIISQHIHKLKTIEKKKFNEDLDISEVKVNMKNQEKIKPVNYHGFSTDISSYKNKTKLYIKTQRTNDTEDFYGSISNILNEYIGFAILKDISTVFKGIKVPKINKISYEIQKEEIQEMLNADEVNFSNPDMFINSSISMQYIVSSFKAKAKTLERASKELKVAQMFHMFINYALPNILVGNQDAHSGNFITKMNKRFVKDYYIIDLGNAFEKTNAFSLDALKKFFFMEKKADKNSRKLNNQEKDVVKLDMRRLVEKKDNYAMKVIEVFNKQSQYLLNKDFSPIVDKQIDSFTIMYKKAYRDFITTVDNLQEDQYFADGFEKQELMKNIESGLEDRLSEINFIRKKYKDILKHNKLSVKRVVEYLNGLLN